MLLKRRLVVDIETNNILSEMLDFSTLPYKLKNNNESIRKKFFILFVFYKIKNQHCPRNNHHESTDWRNWS